MAKTQIESREVLLDIQGMTCASCVNRVERYLEKDEWVQEANVNLATRIATVHTTAPDDRRLIDAVERSGYGARPHVQELGAREEGRSYARRLVVAVALTVPVLVLSLVVPSFEWSMRLAWILTTPIVFYCGWPFLTSAGRAARHGSTTMDTLIALGSLAAYAYSVWAVAAGRGGHYFDTAAVIITLILVGKTLEARARAGAGDAARVLLARGAKQATVSVDGRERRVPIDEVVPGDLMVVMPGERIPTDGRVSRGTSWIDLSMLTGESVPVDVGPGDDVVGAAINGDGRLLVSATAIGAGTKLSEIVRLLQQAQGSKAPVQRLADRVSSVFVPIVMVIALATFLAWWLLGAVGPGAAMLHAVTVLLIACPCALGLATPAAIMAGTGRAAELGILFKGGEVFEAVHRADSVLLDKTGTVTEGAMHLAQVVPVGGLDEEEVLALAAAVERGSEHPIARAVVEAATRREIVVADSAAHKILPGAGAEAIVEGIRVSVGRPEGLPAGSQDALRRLAAEGLTTFVVRRGEETIGLIGVADTVKPEARQAIARLRSMGFELAMVTGDRRQAAEAIAGRVGIERVLAEVYPGGKVEEVRRLQAKARHVVFVGDGVNDAPALARADVGVAVGTGTDVAIAAADVTLLGGNLDSVGVAIDLAHRTYRVIGQNLAWAFAYNVVMIPLAVFGVLTPIWAAGAMAASSVSVVANALRLRRYQRSTEGIPGASGGV